MGEKFHLAGEDSIINQGAFTYQHALKWGPGTCAWCVVAQVKYFTISSRGPTTLLKWIPCVHGHLLSQVKTQVKNLTR